MAFQGRSAPKTASPQRPQRPPPPPNQPIPTRNRFRFRKPGAPHGARPRGQFSETQRAKEASDEPRRGCIATFRWRGTRPSSDLVKVSSWLRDKPTETNNHLCSRLTLSVRLGSRAEIPTPNVTVLGVGPQGRVQVMRVGALIEETRGTSHTPPHTRTRGEISRPQPRSGNCDTRSTSFISPDGASSPRPQQPRTTYRDGVKHRAEHSTHKPSRTLQNNPNFFLNKYFVFIDL